MPHDGIYQVRAASAKVYRSHPVNPQGHGQVCRQVFLFWVLSDWRYSMKSSQHPVSERETAVSFSCASHYFHLLNLCSCGIFMSICSESLMPLVRSSISGISLLIVLWLLSLLIILVLYSDFVAVFWFFQIGNVCEDSSDGCAFFFFLGLGFRFSVSCMPWVLFPYRFEVYRRYS